MVPLKPWEPCRDRCLVGENAGEPNRVPADETEARELLHPHRAQALSDESPAAHVVRNHSLARALPPLAARSDTTGKAQTNTHRDYHRSLSAWVARPWTYMCGGIVWERRAAAESRTGRRGCRAIAPPQHWVRVRVGGPLRVRVLAGVGIRGRPWG